MPRLIRWFVVLVLIGAGTGCKSSEPVPPSMVVTGSTDMNLGNVARVQVTQLKSDARFMAVPLEVFWRDAAAALREDLIRIEQDFLLYPGNEQTFEIVLDDQASYLGVAVDLREPEGDRWRRVISTDGLQGRRVRVTVGEHRVMIEP